MQMWNLHSRVPAGRPAGLSVCQPAAWAARAQQIILGSAQNQVALGFPTAEDTSPRRALGCGEGRGLNRARAGLLWLLGWGASCWTLAVCLGFPPPVLLAPQLRGPRGQTRATGPQPALLSASLASLRFCPGPIPFHETLLTFPGTIVEPCCRPGPFL